MTNLKINLSKKACIIWGTIIGLFLIIGIYQLRHPSIFYYEKDYFGKVGLPESHLYESVVEKMGEPLRIEETEDGYIVYYNGLELAYGSIKTGAVKYVKVTGEQYRFGMWKIGVGSNRKEVESVYRHKIQWSTDEEIEVCDYDYENKEFIYSEMWIHFEFDENNLVKAMYISRGY